MRYFWVWIGLSMGNFAYQLLKEEANMGEALERSFFQGMAILAIYFIIR